MAGARIESVKTGTIVRSPAGGRLLQRLHESEQVILAGTPLLQIGRLEDIEFVAEYLSQDAIRIKAGMPALVEAWGGNEPIPATVRTTEPYAETKFSALGVEEQRVLVIARPDAGAALPALGHGYRIDLRVIIKRSPDALRVPVDALVRTAEGWAVFAVEDGRAALRPVQVSEGDEQHWELLSGVTEGSTVILFPGESLKAGDPVKTRRRELPSKPQDQIATAR